MKATLSRDHSYMVKIKPSACATSAFAERQRRHQLRARLAEKFRHRNDLKSRGAKSVDNLRQGFHGVAAIAAAVVQKHDIAAVGARLLEHALHDHIRGSGRNAARLAPIVRIDARADDDVAHGLGDGKLRDFVRGFGLVVDAVRGTKQQRLHAQRAVQQALGDVEFHVNLRPRGLFPLRVRVGVVADFMTFVVFTANQSQVVVGGASDHKESRRRFFLFQDIQNLGREGAVRTVIETQRDLVRHRAHLEDAIGGRKRFVIVPDDRIGCRIEANRAAPLLRRVRKLPDIAVSFQNQVVARRHILKFCAARVIGMRIVPDRPDRRILRAQPPERGALHAHAFGGAEFVVRRHSIEHPDVMNDIVLVRIFEVGVERVRIKLDFSFRFLRRHDGFLEVLHFRLFVGFQSSRAGPVVRVVGDAHDQFLRGNQFQNRVDVSDKPVLRGDGACCRRAPVLVVIHQNHGVRRLADAGVVIHPIRGGQANHQLQVGTVQVRGEFGDELSEILLAFFRNFFKINNQPGGMALRQVLNRLVRQMLACRRVFQHGGHFIGEPIRPVGIIEQRHDGDFDRRILLLQRLQECRQLGIRFDIQPAARGDRVQAFGNQDVDVAVMLLERGKRCGVPTHIKCGAQWIVGGRHLAE